MNKQAKDPWKEAYLKVISTLKYMQCELHPWRAETLGDAIEVLQEHMPKPKTRKKK